jgi:hypothetical protein
MMGASRNIRDSDQHDVVGPAWRRFWSEHCWPAWRLDRCSADELQRLRKAVPYLMTAIDQAIARKQGAFPQ